MQTLRTPIATAIGQVEGVIADTSIFAIEEVTRVDRAKFSMKAAGELLPEEIRNMVKSDMAQIQGAETLTEMRVPFERICGTVLRLATGTNTERHQQLLEPLVHAGDCVGANARDLLMLPASFFVRSIPHTERMPSRATH